MFVHGWPCLNMAVRVVKTAVASASPDFSTAREHGSQIRVWCLGSPDFSTVHEHGSQIRVLCLGSPDFSTVHEHGSQIRVWCLGSPVFSTVHEHGSQIRVLCLGSPDFSTAHVRSKYTFDAWVRSILVRRMTKAQWYRIKFDHVRAMQSNHHVFVPTKCLTCCSCYSASDKSWAHAFNNPVNAWTSADKKYLHELHCLCVWNRFTAIIPRAKKVLAL